MAPSPSPPAPDAPRTRRKAVRVAMLLLGLATAAYTALLAALYVGQERLIFRAAPLPADHRFVFDQPFEEIRIPVPGATLDALLFPQPGSRGLVFFLHGNAGNLQTWTRGVDFYRRIGWDFFIVDYRGYGRSSGQVESEEQLVADVRAAYDAIAPRYRGRPIVLVGRSLGTGLAAGLARSVDPALLVLISPYASLVEAGQRAYPFAPAFIARYPLATDRILGNVGSPILILHGSRDTLIPPSDSERLAALARAPVERVVVEGAGHSDLQAFPAYLDALADRLGRIGRTDP